MKSNVIFDVTKIIHCEMAKCYPKVFELENTRFRLVVFMPPSLGRLFHVKQFAAHKIRTINRRRTVAFCMIKALGFDSC